MVEIIESKRQRENRNKQFNTKSYQQVGLSSLVYYHTPSLMEHCALYYYLEQTWHGMVQSKQSGSYCYQRNLPLTNNEGRQDKVNGYLQITSITIDHLPRPLIVLQALRNFFQRKVLVKREWKSKKVALHKAHSQLPNFKCPFKTGAEKLRQAQRNSAAVSLPYVFCY